MKIWLNPLLMKINKVNHCIRKIRELSVDLKPSFMRAKTSIRRSPLSVDLSNSI